MSMLLYPTLNKVWKVSFPLMLTMLSANLMFLFDRLILFHYSIEAMNTVAVATMSCAIFQFGGVAVASIAEVFVGQYNGAQQYEKISQPVWQMIWFSLGLFFVFFPIALWAGPYLIPVSLYKEGLSFFKWIILFSPLMAMITALSSFFIGRGLVKFVTWCALIGNAINAALNVMLVFGVKGYLPSIGVKGSTIATIVSQIIQVLLLMSVFLNKYHRKNFKTGYYNFNRKLFIDCIKIGAPSAISHMIEIAAWAALFQIAASVNQDYITIQTVGNSVLVFLFFITEGIQKGVLAFASNLIGAKKDDLIPELLRSSCFLHFIFVFILSIPLFFYPDLIISQFFLDTQNLNLSLYRECVKVLRLTWIYFSLVGIVWILNGILTSGRDTRFIMIINASSAWIFAILPIYIAVNFFHVSSSTAWGLCIIYGITNLTAFLWRYRSNKWKK